MKRTSLTLIIASLVFWPWLPGCSQSACKCRKQAECDSCIERLEYPIAWEKNGTYSSISRSVRILVRDQATLEQVPLSEVPVDFSSQMVLVLGLGPTPSDDMGVRIVKVWEECSRLRVQERQIHPGPDQKPGLNPASPWTIVVIPRSDLNVEGYSPVVPANLFAGRPSAGGAGQRSSGAISPFSRP